MKFLGNNIRMRRGQCEDSCPHQLPIQDLLKVVAEEFEKWWMKPAVWLVKRLDTSLQRMNTSYVDMYFIHPCKLMLFNALPTNIKAKILKTDYSKAEKYCPQKIQIGKVLKKTHEDLT